MIPWLLLFSHQLAQSSPWSQGRLQSLQSGGIPQGKTQTPKVAHAYNVAQAFHASARKVSKSEVYIIRMSTHLRHFLYGRPLREVGICDLRETPAVANKRKGRRVSTSQNIRQQEFYSTAVKCERCFRRFKPVIWTLCAVLVLQQYKTARGSTSRSPPWRIRLSSSLV